MHSNSRSQIFYTVNIIVITHLHSDEKYPPNILTAEPMIERPTRSRSIRNNFFFFCICLVKKSVSRKKKKSMVYWEKMTIKKKSWNVKILSHRIKEQIIFDHLSRRKDAEQQTYGAKRRHPMGTDANDGGVSGRKTCRRDGGGGVTGHRRTDKSRISGWRCYGL